MVVLALHPMIEATTEKGTPPSSILVASGVAHIVEPALHTCPDLCGFPRLFPAANGLFRIDGITCAVLKPSPAAPYRSHGKT